MWFERFLSCNMQKWLIHLDHDCWWMQQQKNDANHGNIGWRYQPVFTPFSLKFLMVSCPNTSSPTCVRWNEEYHYYHNNCLHYNWVILKSHSQLLNNSVDGLVDFVNNTLYYHIRNWWWYLSFTHRCHIHILSLPYLYAMHLLSWKSA